MPIEQSKTKEVSFKELISDSITAAIFDMDDLMVDSHKYHRQLFDIVLSRYGSSLNNPENPLLEQEEAALFGLKISEHFPFFAKKFGIVGTTAEEMTEEYDRLVVPFFEQADVSPMPGLIELIQQLKESNLKLAVASSSSHAKIAVVLKKLGLEETFSVTVSGEDEIKHGKPAPDIFLAAAAKLGVEPIGCIVFEDAEAGVEAAKAAGMIAVGVHNRFAFERLGIRQNLSRADFQVAGLDGIDLR